MSKTKQVGDFVISKREYLFWFAFLNQGPTQDVLDQSDGGIDELFDEVVTWVKDKQKKR